jgi:L-asparaginase
VAAGAVASGDLNAYQARILTALLVAGGTPAGSFHERFCNYI